MPHWRVFDVANKSTIVPPTPPNNFEVNTKVTHRPTSGDRHEYHIEFYLKNISNTKVDDFRVDIEFPIDFINLNTSYHLEVREQRTKTHMLFRKSNPDPNTGRRTTLYSNDEVRLLSTDYFVTSELFDQDALNKEMKITVFSGNLRPEVTMIPMTKLTDY